MKSCAIRRLVVGLMVLASAEVLVAEGAFAATANVPIGQKVGKLAFKDIRFLNRSLADFSGKKAFVIVCTNTTCPVVQQYLPKLKRLDEKYRGQGVQFLSLNVNPGDSIREMAAHAVGFDLAFPTVKDTTGETVAALGVSRTPEAVVLTSDFVLKYRGRIDDQYRVVGEAASPKNNDLENAIEAVLAGKPVAVAETTVDGCLITHAAPPTKNSSLTYHKDIAPILRKHCVECHQPGTEAPFSLLTYEEAKKQGATLAEVVGDQAMPPWYAASAHDDFINHREMSDTERDTLISWVHSGMPAGEKVADATPIPLRKVVGDGWLIGKPDLVLKTKLHSVPSEGFVNYRYEPLSYVFPQDTWIDRIQILPDNPKVVHHCNLILVPAFGDKVKNAIFVTGKVPGGIPMVLEDGIAVRVPKMYLALAYPLHDRWSPRKMPDFCRISLCTRKSPEGTAPRADFQPRFRDCRRRSALQGHGVLDDQAGHHRHGPLHPHACPRDRHDVSGPLPGRQDGDAARGAELQFRLADRLRLGAGDAEVSGRDEI